MSENQVIIQSSKPANYQLISQYQLNQNQNTFAIAINMKQTIMIAGCGNKIKVFDFQNGQIKQTQSLSDHKSNVYTLYFMKNTNQFISGSDDKTIRIWSFNDIQWYCQALLKDGHLNTVTQVIMNQNDDLIISCSYDKCIKFWRKKNEWQCQQTLIAHTNIVSLNDSENQLVSCGHDSLIVISQLVEYKSWAVIQKIKVEQFGFRICFLGDNSIAFQQYNSKRMDIFEFNQVTNEFVKYKYVKIENDQQGCSSWFPHLFINQKSILLSKNAKTINLMKKKNNGEIVLEQQIFFQNNCVTGTMTEDGKYLITWDQINAQFQVRKQEQ